MVREDDVGRIADAELLWCDRDAFLFQALDLFDEGQGVDDDSVADDAFLAFPEHAGGHQVKHILLPLVVNRVASIGTTLSTDDDVGVLCQVVNNLSFPLVTP